MPDSLPLGLCRVLTVGGEAIRSDAARSPKNSNKAAWFPQATVLFKIVKFLPQSEWTA
ncbi:hypothetical protein QT972_01250 [Microcoleus sp. herbarium7]|uniref:hypothetical protein n=1 Tax=Microcoleus sp. herbarium7 TaxID=3055435 RepID=UPI002FD448B7